MTAEAIAILFSVVSLLLHLGVIFFGAVTHLVLKRNIEELRKEVLLGR